MSRISAFMGAAGVLNGIYSRLVKEVEKVGGTGDDIHRLTTPAADDVWPKIAELIANKVHQAFKVVVDYGRSLSEMVAAGKYDWINSDIVADHFPVKGEGKQEREIVLFHFNHDISSDDAIKEMVVAGYRPALIEELLVLGEVQPELQKQFPIVALGSVWRFPDGYRFVACLCRYDAERYLYLGYFEGDWGASDRFAAVRNA